MGKGIAPFQETLRDLSIRDSLERELIDFPEKRNDIVVLTGFEEDIEVLKKDLLISLHVLPILEYFEKEVEEKFLFNSNNFEADMVDYLDMVIKELQDQDGEAVGEKIAEVLVCLSDLAVAMNERMGATISLFSLHEALKLCSEETQELMEKNYSDISSFDEVEKMIDDDTKELFARLSEKSDIWRRIIVNSNFGQLKQVLVSIGPRPNLKGDVIPVLPDTNFLRGLRGVQDFFINAQTGRKVQIISHRNVRQSGYLARKLSLLAINTKICKEDDPNREDCGSQNYQRLVVTDGILKRLNGRWFGIDEESDELHMINTADPEVSDLIGETIYLRSPMTCAGDRICDTCYGELSHLNRNMHIGAIAVLFLSSPFTQKLLSAKHLLQTKSPKFDWSEEFLANFSVNRTAVVVHSELTSKLILEEDVDVHVNDDTGELYADSLTILSGSTKTKIELPSRLYLMTEFIEGMQKYRNADRTWEIPLKEWGDQVLFMVEVKNEEITTSLNQIKSLIETSDHLGVGDDRHELLQKILELIDRNTVFIDSVHVECILRNLLRTPEDVSQRPDWYEPDVESVSLRLVDAIIKGPSVTAALSFEQLIQQINDPKTFLKTGKSEMDCFYTA